jgi:hypothetical protein
VILSNVVPHGYAVAQVLGRSYNPACDACISRSEDHRLLSGVIYQEYTKSSITMHTATFVRNSYGRDFLWIMFHYPFVALGVKVLFAPVEETNGRSIALCRKLGFKEVARIADYYPSGAQCLYAMRRDECRWLVLTPRTLNWAGVSDGRQQFSASTSELQADQQAAEENLRPRHEDGKSPVALGEESLPSEQGRRRQGNGRLLHDDDGPADAGKGRPR